MIVLTRVIDGTLRKGMKIRLLMAQQSFEVEQVGVVTPKFTEVGELSEMTTRLRTLERLNRLVSSSLDFEAVLVAIARAASDITATPVVSFWLVDEVSRTVTVRAWKFLHLLSR